MKPTIGRIVLFNAPGRGGVLGQPPTKCPAIIQAVGPTSLRLAVFGPNGFYMEEAVSQGIGTYEWEWPEIEEKRDAARTGVARG